MNYPTPIEAPSSRFAQYFRNRYEAESAELDTHLAACVSSDGGLTGAVEALFEHQIQAGVLRDDLHEVERFQLLDPADHHGRAFFFTVNPRRADRHRGGGRLEPPPGWSAVHGNCFLCRENITWQQRFLQLCLPIELPSGRFEAWVNPFPLGLRHVTIAAAEHQPQAWQAAEREIAEARLVSRLQDLVDLARRLPGYLVFENGVGAGASIPRHHHYQALQRWPGLDRFPIEETARTGGRGDGSDATLFPLRSYPVSSFVCRGTAEVATAAAREAAARWFGAMEEHGAGWDHVATNLIAIRNRAGRDAITLFIVPRNGHINRAQGADSPVASLEIAGEMIASDPASRERIQNGRISYRSIWDTIASCQDAGSRRMVERVLE